MCACGIIAPMGRNCLVMDCLCVCVFPSLILFAHCFSISASHRSPPCSILFFSRISFPILQLVSVPVSVPVSQKCFQ